MQVVIQKSMLNKRLLFTKPLKTVQFQNPKSQNTQIEVVKSLKDMSIKQRSNLIETYKTVFKEPPYEEFFTNKEIFENFNEILKNKNGTLLTLRNGDEILGFIAGYEKSKNTFWIEDLGIIPQNQRSGNGSKLIDSITDYAIKLGYSNLSLKTSIYNEKGINFYKKKGFLLTNKTILVPTNKIQMTIEENVEKITGVDVRVIINKKISNDELLDIKNNNRIERMVLARASGNPTLLIFDQDFIGKGVELSREFLGESIQKFCDAKYPEAIEQGGILTLSQDKNCIGRLEMFGGEFCGNATRSAVWYLTNGTPGKGKIEVSGVSRPLEYLVSEDNSIKVEMPLLDLKKSNPNMNEYTVTLEGITHIVILDYAKKLINLTDDELKKYATNKLKNDALLTLPASGISIYEPDTGKSKFVVWVRDQETLYNETSCGSGTSAIGAVLSTINKSSSTIKIIQPSGEFIETESIFDETTNKLKKIYIKGKVETLYDGKYN